MHKTREKNCAKQKLKMIEKKVNRTRKEPKNKVKNYM